MVIIHEKEKRNSPIWSDFTGRSPPSHHHATTLQRNLPECASANFTARNTDMCRRGHSRVRDTKMAAITRNKCKINSTTITTHSTTIADITATQWAEQSPSTDDLKHSWHQRIDRDAPSVTRFHHLLAPSPCTGGLSRVAPTFPIIQRCMTEQLPDYTALHFSPMCYNLW